MITVIKHHEEIVFLYNKYNELYDRASAVLKKYNPCNVRNGKCNRAQHGGENFCCSEPECKYLTPKGCSTKSLSCRMWFCSSRYLGFWKRIRFKAEMDVIRKEATKYNMCSFRGTSFKSIRQSFRHCTRLSNIAGSDHIIVRPLFIIGGSYDPNLSKDLMKKNLKYELKKLFRKLNVSATYKRYKWNKKIAESMRRYKFEVTEVHGPTEVNVFPSGGESNLIP
jgi:hypothetical protein